MGIRRAGSFFAGSSTAGTAQIFNQNGGLLAFVDSSNLGARTIRNYGGDAARFTGAYMTLDDARGGTASIILDGAVANGAFGAQVYVSANTHLENATITAHGSDVTGGGGAIIQFDGPAHADNATLIAEGGTNGGGGATIFFFNTTTGDNARAIVHPGASFDLSGLQKTTFSIGSIEGGGTFSIGLFSGGGGAFTVGSNNLSTTVSGTIKNAGLYANNPGRLIKTGTGTLTLSGNNTYSGGTVVGNGVIVVDNASGLGLGTGTLSTTGDTFGELRFTNGASAGSVTITNLAHTLQRSLGGRTIFLDDSSAGTARITNNASDNVAILGSSFTEFKGRATAADAILTNAGTVIGSSSLDGGQINFYDDSTAGRAQISNGRSGDFNFFGNSTAGASTITSAGAAFANPPP